MHNPLAKRSLVLDGGFATELERSFKKQLPTQLWASSMLYEDPDAVFGVHYSFFDAGADIVTTSTYQTSFSGFQKAGYDALSTTELLKKAVHLAVKARDMYWSRSLLEQSMLRDSSSPDTRPPQTCLSQPLVAASLGCYGASLANGSEYTGDYNSVSDPEIYKHHLDRIQAMLSQPGVDILAFESIPKLSEGRVINDLMRKEGLNVPAWVAYTCKDAENVSHGETFKECVDALDAQSVIAVGINCTAPALVKPLLLSLHTSSEPPGFTASATHQPHEYASTNNPHAPKRIIVYPNSGESWDAENKIWLHGNNDPGATAPDFARLAKEEWIPNGASIIGGCCRTTPEYVREMKMILTS
ncbi:hypothetical protein SeMB42_g04950 [Synchytrium endobioticum]|uniref:Hcy-binding domain-containing protein n=1 Tax=Synchytrium endobioticum TaxID=286115 RepID=A0A507CV25_9FUNG|nr:hypothetical protein SeLEV6574_g05615 [Synchytrium endobioticum]TPX42901.1 hypothetical protein SeMB42_g04950 [Synchytrium endobioticum]